MIRFPNHGTLSSSVLISHSIFRSTLLFIYPSKSIPFGSSFTKIARGVPIVKQLQRIERRYFLGKGI